MKMYKLKPTEKDKSFSSLQYALKELTGKELIKKIDSYFEIERGLVYGENKDV